MTCIRSSAWSHRLVFVSLALASGCAAVGGAAPTGGDESVPAEDAEKMKAVGGKAKGRIVWSSSRLGNHDLFAINTDGSDMKQLTQGDAVDWFPRYAPDGSNILFVRSRKGWVSERDANTEGKWDLFTLPTEGGTPTKVVDDASWGTWVSQDTILFVRGTRIFRKTLGKDAEELLVDSSKESALGGALLQQPQMSRDGRYIAITLRGSKRETGLWDLTAKTWTRTGDGCQINWTPDGSAIYWVHPTGNGGSRVFREAVSAGKPTKEIPDDEKTFIDLPGRRSHEYFPELSADGAWMVWAATQRGHDHDTADYELYLWEVGRPPEEAARLTFHSGNDRWPDIFLPGAVAAAAGPATSAPAKGEEKPGLQPASLREPAAKSGKTKARKKR